MASTGLRILSGLLIASLTLSLAAVVQPAAISLQAQGQTGVVIAEDSRLNVRSGPGVSFAIVGKLDPGAEVQVLSASDDGGWYEIRAGEIEGWAAAEFISTGGAQRVSSEASLLPTPTATPGGQPGPGSILARLAPPAASPKLDPQSSSTRGIFDQEPAHPLAEATSEATVAPTATPAAADAAESVEQNVEEAAPSAETATPAATPSVPTAIIQPTRMNVRGGPGTTFEVISSAAAGTGFEITGKTADSQWYRIKLADGGTGWLFAQLTAPAGPVESVPVLAQEELPQPPAAPVETQAAAAPPVVAAPPPAGGGFFGYGIQAHLLGGGAGSAFNAVNDLGFNWIKQQVEWRLFQPDPGAIGFGELGGIVSEAGNRGIRVLFSVVNAPGWAREPGYDASVGGPPADPQTYANFVGAMAGQFCNTALGAIEIWNEQNLHYEWGNKPLDPAEYMNLLKAAYTSIKAACPSMLVISGALTPAGSNPPFAMDDFAYLEGMYQNGLANYADGIGAHPSGYNVPASVRWEEACGVIQQTGNSFNGACDSPHHSWSFRSTMEGYRNIMVAYGDANKRIWPTEFGWAAGGAFDPRYAYANDNSFDEQAAWTVEAYTMMRDWGWVGPAFLWNLNFRVVADGTEKAQWGIVRNDWSPLPVYEALKAMPK
ncbi:MAG TPA: SH3 domain-containing protein [Caldilineaceae bacterium]|nr:SH3 domain-containing protein [Caldilineaceae bacterium]